MTTKRTSLLLLCGIALFPLACSSNWRTSRTVAYSGPFRSTERTYVREVDYFDHEDEEIERHVIEVEYDD